MKNKKVAVVLICLFFVYVMLALFNSLYWTSAYDGNLIVTGVGTITDGEALEIVWIPGQLFGFFLTMIIGDDVTIAGALCTFLIGAFIIMRFFKLSITELIGTRRIPE
jgi:hypothetical protein